MWCIKKVLQGYNARSYNKLSLFSLSVLTFIGYKQTPKQTNIIDNRILGSFAHIFYLNCEHVLVVYIVKQKQNKFRGFHKNNFVEKFSQIKFFKANF